MSEQTKKALTTILINVASALAVWGVLHMVTKKVETEKEPRKIIL